MHRGLLAALLSIGLLIALALPPVASAGTLDQQQTDFEGSYGLFSTVSLAQTFTAGISGNLDEVDLDLINGGGGGGLYVEIRDASSSGPGETILASHIVPESAIPVPITFVPVKLDSPAPVAAGTQYAIVAYTSASSGSGYRWGRGPFGDSYPGGAGFSVGNSPPSGPWGPLGADLVFKTYVVPTSASTGKRAAALKKCKKKAKQKDWSKERLKKCKRKAKLLPA